MNRLIAKTGVSRRMAVKAMLAMGVGTPALAAQTTGLPQTRADTGPSGTATDPDLLHPHVPWQRTLSETDLTTLACLADLILPGDERSPPASVLGAHEFIDEWVSAPYEPQQEDRLIILSGLEWLTDTCAARYQRPFVDLAADEQLGICDQICYLPQATADALAGAVFFARVRDLTAAAVWTTEEGMADLQYVGNVPLAKWELPPANVLKHLGLDQN